MILLSYMNDLHGVTHNITYDLIIYEIIRVRKNDFYHQVDTKICNIGVKHLNIPLGVMREHCHCLSFLLRD